MYAKAALGMIPRPRPKQLPDRRLHRSAVVDREHLTSYQRVCGFGVGDRLPATYPHVLGFGLAMRLMVSGDFPLPLVGLVHVGNRIEQRRPLTADDRFEIEVYARDLRDHPRGRQFAMITTATVAGVQVWHETSTYLRKEGKATASPAEQWSPGRAPEQAGRPDAIWRVPVGVGPAYARVSGDHNPIHTSRIGARLFGFPRPIAHGMWSKAHCLAALAGRLPAEYVIDVAFKLPILLPARAGFSYADGGFTLADIRSGKPHLFGTLEELAQ